MVIGKTPNNREYIIHIGDVDNQKTKGYHKHNAFTGRILSCIGKAFKDQDDGWVNTKSVTNYLKRNADKLGTQEKDAVLAFNDHTSAADVAKIFRDILTPPIVQVPSPAPISLATIAQDIYDNRVKLFKDAGSNEAFINKIREKFREHGHSFSELHQSPEGLNLFLNSSVLRPALVAYAKQNGLKEILSAHLHFVTNVVFVNRDDLWRKARNGNEEDDGKAIYDLCTLIREEFRKEGRSLIEIFGHKEALDVFRQSTRLTLALVTYHSMLTKPKAPAVSEQNNHEDILKKIAIKEGRAHAKVPGFVTQLEFQEFASNEVALAAEVKKFLIKNHPDRNPDANQDLVKAANNLNELLKHGNYPLYQEAREKERKEN